MATQRVTRSKSKNQNGFDEQLTNGSSNHATNGDLSGHEQFTDPPTKSLLSKLINEVLVPLWLIPFAANLIVSLWFTTTQCDGSFLVFYQRMMDDGVLNGLIKMWSGIEIGNPLILSIIGCYMVFALILQVILPGPRVEGPVTPKGNTPVYKDNGFFCYIVTMVVFVGLTYYLKENGMTPTVIYDHFGEVLVNLTLFSVVFCIFLQIKGLVAPSSTDCGSSGNPLFDFYWGTELYPRIFGVDIKVFTNCRFGMTVWPLLCLIFALKSYELYGFVDSMWVSCVLQMVYFTKFFWWEAGYMRTIDIILDRAGFYICWGCLVYVPGLYASVSLYLVNHPVHLGPVWSSVILGCGLASVYINYWADEQKIAVRRSNGQCKVWGKPAKVIRAKYTLEGGEKRESILLVCGFWGIARHFHYLPELMAAFLWTVPALFDHLMVYSYFIFLLILLIHRTYRDDEKCAAKYGKYWKEYSASVPYKIIPGVF